MSQNPGPGSGESKLHIDTDWKAQARAEKERLAAEQAKKAEEAKAKAATLGGAAAPAGPAPAPAAEGAADAAAEAGHGPMPPADFKTLISSFITQAFYAMGQIADPQTGQRFLDLPMAAHQIDMLDVLAQKTKGNLTDEEQKLMDQALRELRIAFTEISRQYAAHLAAQASGQVPGGMSGMGGMGPIKP